MGVKELTKVFLISHTHWDREWYLTREKSRFMLIQLVDEMLTLLDDQPDYVFMLDGQTIVLEDYLEIRPEKEREIRVLIKAGRLLVGPWYVLADEFLISGESHIRNYLVGRNLCRKFGGNMNLGYLPDSFGHPEQMPQILKGLGLHEIIFLARSWPGNNEVGIHLGRQRWNRDLQRQYAIRLRKCSVYA